MSKSTPRAALPPLPPPAVKAGEYAGPPGEGASENYWSAEQVEQIRRETVQACADLCAAEQAENRGLAKGSKTAMYDWVADGAGLCRGAILALLPVKEPQA